MNKRGYLVTILTALALATFALPAAAADKVFTLTAKTYSASGAPIGNTIPALPAVSVLLLDFNNLTPNQFNSVFKSVQVDIPVDITYKVIQATTVNNGVCGPPPTNPAPPTTTSTPLTLNNLTGVKPSGHFCLYLAVKTSLTTCTGPVQWKGYANTGATITGGQPFFDPQNNPFATTSTTDGCTGVLGCGTTPGDNLGAGGLSSQVFSDNAFVGTPDWGLVRGPNANTTSCTLVPYQFTLDLITQVASFTVNDGDKGLQTLAVEYVVLWPAVNPDAAPDATAGWTQRRPKLSWGIANPDPLNPTHFVSALACVIDPPTLSGLTPAQLQALLPIIPNVPEFANSPYAQYQPGQPAKMCIAQQGWTSVGLDGNGNILVQYWDKVIDESDGTIIPR